MSDTPPDLASTLAGIRERADAAAAMDVDVLAAFNGVSVGGVIAASAVDVPLLLAALEAVLKLADSAKVTGTTICACQDCTTARGNGFTGIHRLQAYMWDLDPAKLREAITRELTGKEAGDETAAT